MGGHLELWVLLSFAAACFQTMRFMLQKVVSTQALTATGATFARFLYSAPLIVLGVGCYVLATGQAVVVPEPARFWLFAASGGIAQVMATVAVVTIFKTRNFAVGITLKKSEVILSVLVGFVVLGDGLSGTAFVAILIGLAGVLFLSPMPQVSGIGWRDIGNRSAGLGLGAGALFAVSAVCYRGASLEIASADAALRAGLTLGAVTSLQLIGMWVWLAWRDHPQIASVWRARRVAVWIGLLSLAGSFCWFFAFTLQAAALVKAVGQVELVLSVLASVLFFGERISARELIGIVLVSGSILLLVLLG